MDLRFLNTRANLNTVLSRLCGGRRCREPAQLGMDLAGYRGSAHHRRAHTIPSCQLSPFRKALRRELLLGSSSYIRKTLSEAGTAPGA
jgi:hypothetical protein